MATSGKQIRALAIIVASSAVVGLVAAAVSSLLGAARASSAKRALLRSFALRTQCELDEVIAWCLKKDPDQGPQSATELSERLLSIHSLDRWTKHDAEAWWKASSLRAKPETSPAA